MKEILLKIEGIQDEAIENRVVEALSQAWPEIAVKCSRQRGVCQIMTDLPLTKEDITSVLAPTGCKLVYAQGLAEPDFQPIETSDQTAPTEAVQPEEQPAVQEEPVTEPVSEVQEPSPVQEPSEPAPVQEEKKSKEKKAKDKKEKSSFKKGKDKNSGKEKKEKTEKEPKEKKEKPAPVVEEAAADNGPTPEAPAKKKSTVKWIIAAVAAIIVLAIIFVMEGVDQDQESTVLITDQVTLEYGESLDTIADQLVEGSSSRLSFNMADVRMDEALDVPAVGVYNVEVYKGSASLGTVQVTVEDTTAPVFVKAPNSIQVDEGNQVDIQTFFEADDLSGAILQADLKNVDVYTPGSYQAIVYAKDPYGNTDSVNVTVQVLEQEGYIELDDTPGRTVNGILIVNKKNPLSESYDPGEDPTARKQLDSLIADMQAAGLNVSNNFNGYRSYASQEVMYNNYVSWYGQDYADSYVGKAGYSENQTGLAFDLIQWDGSFVTDTAAVNWLKEHAADYGFIIRYPEGKEDITGFGYQPWHLRYIGEEAKYIMDNNLTLEEYLNVTGGDYE